MYESFFNLHRKPFELVPNPEFLYPSRSHRQALLYLDYGIRERIGFILLTGEVGSGKTTIVRNLIRKYREDVVISKIFNTRVESTELLAAINEDFGIPVAGNDRIRLLRDLNRFLIDRFAAGEQPVLIIDEAQNLSMELLEEVRMLSNIETDDAKLLQIVLVGQPELRRALAMPEMRQLRQRISIACHLAPLSRTDTENYIYHRLETAGNRQALTFTEEAMETVFRHSGGIPRLINVICEFLLLSAFADDLREMDAAIVEEIIQDAGLCGCIGEAEAAAAPGEDPVLPIVQELREGLQTLAGKYEELERRLAGPAPREAAVAAALDPTLSVVPEEGARREGFFRRVFRP